MFRLMNGSTLIAASDVIEVAYQQAADECRSRGRDIVIWYKDHINAIFIHGPNLTILTKQKVTFSIIMVGK